MMPQDLMIFHRAIHQLERLEPSSDRRKQQRYAPVGPLARARVSFDGGVTGEVADVVDLSFNGLRLAVAACCTCREGDRCTIEISPDGAMLLSLDAEVRWVKTHPFITVFGVLLNPDQIELQPV